MNNLNNQTQNLIKLMTNSVLSTVQLFGFDLQSTEKLSKCAFNSSAFSKPNQKAFELIVHCLLCQLDSEKAQRVFSQCWPPILKEQQKEFKDAIYYWLLEISNASKQQSSSKNLPTSNTNSSSGVLPLQYQSFIQNIKFPIVTKSLLLTPGGLKICELLFALSQYVLIVRLIKLSKKKKTLDLNSNFRSTCLII